jgi:hypothetical protein
MIFFFFGSYLVGGIPTPLKNISQLGLLFPIYGKKMFQTTNQLFFSVVTVEGTTWVAALMKPAWEMEL